MTSRPRASCSGPAALSGRRKQNTDLLTYETDSPFTSYVNNITLDGVSLATLAGHALSAIFARVPSFIKVAILIAQDDGEASVPFVGYHIAPCVGGEMIVFEL